MYPVHTMTEVAIELSRLDGEDFAMEAWIRAHPAMRMMCSRRQQLTREMDLVYSALSEEWKRGRDGNAPVFPDEGKIETEESVLAQADARIEQWKQEALDEEEMLASIAKFGVKVPVRKQPEKPAEKPRSEEQPVAADK